VIAMGLLCHGGRVLLGHRRADRRWYPDCWDLFGGHVEPGEDPRAALVRECREELGIAVERATRLDVKLDVPDVEAHVFAVESWTGRLRNAAPEEHDEVRWFGRDDAAGLRFAHPAVEALVREAVSGSAG